MRHPTGAVRQMQDKAPHRPFHPASWLQQPLAQGGHLCSGSEQDSQLIGSEPRATRPAEGEPLMQFFEPILHIPALVVARIHRGGWGTEIGHHEARIAFGLASCQPDDLGLDDPAPPMRPAPVQPVVTSEAAIHADSERGAQERPTLALQQGAQESTGPLFRGTVAGLRRSHPRTHKPGR